MKLRSFFLPIITLIFSLWLIGAGYVMATATTDYTGAILGAVAGAGAIALTGGVGIAAFGTAFGVGMTGGALVGSVIGYSYFRGRDYEVWEWLPFVACGLILTLWALKRLLTLFRMMKMSRKLENVIPQSDIPSIENNTRPKSD